MFIIAMRLVKLRQGIYSHTVPGRILHPQAIAGGEYQMVESACLVKKVSAGAFV
jgi:hypothetical protein